MASDPSPNDSINVLTGDPVVAEAKKFFDRVADWEAVWRNRFMEDLRFANADSENGYQWPNAIRQARDTDARPCLTINMIRQHNGMISNTARKAKSSIKFIGLGNGATQESAQVLSDIMRHIEHQSRAQTAYAIARDYQIDAGLGYWRLATDYVDGESFDQEIYIRPVIDPLSVYMDPDCIQRDTSDAKKCLIFQEIPRDDFKEFYPQYIDIASQQPLGVNSTNDDWVTKDMVRVAEYFRKVPVEDVAVSFVGGGERRSMPLSRMRKLFREQSDLNRVLDHPLTRQRDVVRMEVEWKLIIGEKICDEQIWPGKYIPMIPCKGRQTVIDGILDLKGHTRNMKDAQRMYNYNASSQVEYVALQTKAPYKASSEAIEGHETMWNSANTSNHSTLIFNGFREDGQPIPMPEREVPPNAAPGYQQGMDTAFNQMMMSSGQWQNEMGMAGAERTGAAIDKRQQQSSTATYHFQDWYEEALIYTGLQVLDLIPKIYDTKRIMQVEANNGADYELVIDPGARLPFFQELSHQGDIVRKLFNPSIGKYDVAPKVGPAYDSRRQELVDSLTLILTQAPALTGVIGDILFDAMEFDGAKEAALRMKRMVPPQALGRGPTQAEQQLQQTLQATQAQLAQALQKLGKEQVKIVGKDQLRDIEAYDAETRRFAALKDALPMDQEWLSQVIQQLVEQSLHTSLSQIQAENAAPEDEKAALAASAPAPPAPGARMAGDGEWYLQDPTRRGKFMRVAPLAQERSRPGIIAGRP